MQYQIQAVVPKGQEVQKDDLDLHVGLIAPLTNPYNLFFKVADIMSNASQIYFYAYSIGKDRIVLWGLYDEDTNEFLVDNACKWTKQLNEILASLKSRDYDFYASSSKDNISSRISQNIVFDDLKEVKAEVSTFKRLLLERAKGNMANGQEYDELYLKLAEYAPQILKKKYLNDLYEFLTSEFDAQIRQVKELIDIMITIHFMGDFEDYRIFKYFSVLGKKLEQRYKDSFTYKFLLGSVEAILNLEERDVDQISMAMHVAREMADIYSQDINITNVGVIGGKPVRANDARRVEMLAHFFEKFIARSKYTKTYYINDLKECPLPQDCASDSEECDLYTHGTTKQSRYDLS